MNGPVDWRAWWLAARPKTLPAAAVPVLLGSALAVADGVYCGSAALLCLTFALLIQTGANYANDYYDYGKGADTPQRLGPARMVASGRITPRAMWRATWGVLTAGVAVGLGLIPYGGWWLLPLGLVCAVCAVAYTGGPYPLGYHGWGEVFVFLFFGLVAVVFTHYVQAGFFSWSAVWLGVACGALSCAILIVNNYRDAETDARAGKRTTAVRLGRSFALAEYAFMQGLAMVAPALLYREGRGWLVLLPLGLWFWARHLRARLGQAREREDFGRVLTGTAAYFLVYGLLLSVGLIFPWLGNALSRP